MSDLCCSAYSQTFLHWGHPEPHAPAQPSGPATHSAACPGLPVLLLLQLQGSLTSARAVHSSMPHLNSILSFFSLFFFPTERQQFRRSLRPSLTEVCVTAQPLSIANLPAAYLRHERPVSSSSHTRCSQIQPGFRAAQLRTSCSSIYRHGAR